MSRELIFRVMRCFYELCNDIASSAEWSRENERVFRGHTIRSVIRVVRQSVVSPVHTEIRSDLVGRTHLSMTEV